MGYYDSQRPFAELVGLTLKDVVNVNDAEIRFTVDDGRVYVMYHEGDCCETVEVDEIVGDLSDLIGSPILRAECRESNDDPRVDPAYPTWTPDSFTWTFYEIATVKGSVTIKWWGESNGYYSESVDFRIDAK